MAQHETFPETTGGPIPPAGEIAPEHGPCQYTHEDLLLLLLKISSSARIRRARALVPFTSFVYTTRLDLSTSWGRFIWIPPPEHLCRTLVAMHAVRDLRLVHPAWSHGPTEWPTALNFCSGPRLRRVDLAAGRRWLLSPNSEQLVDWLARSGAVAQVDDLYLGDMMILDQRLLALVQQLVCRSQALLRKPVLCIGPEVRVRPLAYALSGCESLESLTICLPHHASSFHILLELLVVLRPKYLRVLGIRLSLFLHYPMPSSANWKMLDDILQIPPYLGLERITVSGFPIYPGSPHALLSGNLHAYRERDAVADQQAIAKLLPITHNRRALHHWDHPDGTPTRSPARVDAFMPTEVCERIIDLVANAPGEYYVGIVWPEDVQATLAACSLTCRAWRARAQAYLFRALILAGDEAALGRFRRLLTRNPMLSPFVRTCTLYSAPSSPSSALHIAPLSLSPMLPDVESLRILNGTLHIPPRAPFGPCMRRLSSVVQLMLIQVTLPSLADLRRVVCACRQVKELVIMGCEWPHTPATRTSHSARSTCGRSGPRTQVRLTKIALDFPTECAGDPRVVRFLQWLAGSGVMSSAEHISVYPMAVASTELLKAVGAFVCAASRTLEGLYVSMTPTVDFSSLTEAIVQCSKLRWLEFIVPLESTIFAQLAVLLSAGLSQAQAQRELCLRLTLIHPGGAVAEATDEEWRQLDEALEAVGPKILSDVVIYRRFLAGPSTCTDSLDWRLHEDCDDDRLYQRLGDLLPQTCKSKRLWARPASPESGAIYSRIEGSCSRI